jgi:hypothetical protein
LNGVIKIMVWAVSVFIIVFGAYGLMHEDAGILVIIIGIIVGCVGNNRVNQSFPK